MEHWKDLAQWLPFVGVMVSHGDNARRVPPAVVARLLEMALVLGFAYGVYTRDMSQLQTSLLRVETQVNASLSRVEAQVHEIRRDIYRPSVEQLP